MADKIKQQLQEVTSVLDPYGNQIGFVKKISGDIGVNSGLIIAGVLGFISLILMLL